MTNQLRLRLVILLIIFLPLSAWLVSFSGHDWLSLGRDVLLFSIGLSSIFASKKSWRPSNWWLVAFTIWGLLSFFWREESLAQWLRGVRFILEPTILYLCVASTPFASQEKQLILKTFVWVAVVVALLGVVDITLPNLLHFTLSQQNRPGQLVSLHAIGQLPRAEATLAGPNALGLYLMIALGSFLSWRRFFNRYLNFFLLLFLSLGLVLTFSRSSLIGLLLALMSGLVLSRDSINLKTKLALGRTIVLLLIFGAFAFLALPRVAFTHGNSDSIRLEQYKRLWSDRSQISWHGRGIGSAGLVSQNRLDGGPNHFTENSYLDVFEGLGLVGALLYIGVWVTMLGRVLRSQDEFSAGVFMAGLSLVGAGLFVTQFTGQAALWTTIILLAIFGKSNGSPGWTKLGANVNLT